MWQLVMELIQKKLEDKVAGKLGKLGNASNLWDSASGTSVGNDTATGTQSSNAAEGLLGYKNFSTGKRGF
jgi:hypothetical protein